MTDDASEGFFSVGDKDPSPALHDVPYHDGEVNFLEKIYRRDTLKYHENLRLIATIRLYQGGGKT